MIYPKFIKENSCIGIPAPSAGAADNIRQAKMLNAIKKLERLNYKLLVSSNILRCEKGRSANKEVRAKEINNMFKSSEIDMILCATGGEFLIEILPFVDFNLLKNNPKFMVGFSDPTGLLYTATTKYDISTIYGKNLKTLGSEEIHKSEKDFLEIIKGNLITQYNYELFEEEREDEITGLEGYNLTKKVYWNTLDGKNVVLKGRIIGGCFDVIAELAGTKYDGINQFNEKYKQDGIIWYFDNCELSMEETIRTLWRLNEFDYFKYTTGIIFGRFGVNKSYFDYDVKTCLKDSVLNSLQIPIIYDADISHKPPCLTIINGSIATIEVKDGTGSISFELI